MNTNNNNNKNTLKKELEKIEIFCSEYYKILEEHFGRCCWYCYGWCKKLDSLGDEFTENYLENSIGGIIVSYAIDNPLKRVQWNPQDGKMKVKEYAALRYALNKRLRRKLK